MFGSLGGPEIIFVFVLALLLFGPRRLPKIGRSLGRTVAELKKATHEFRSALEREVDLEEIKETRRDLDAVARTAKEAADGVAEAARPRATLGGDPQTGVKPAAGDGTPE